MGRTLMLLLLFSCAKPLAPTPVVEAASTVKADDDFTVEDLQAWADEITPLLEKHAGRRFLRAPVVDFLTVEEFQSFASKESKLIMDAVYADTPAEVREQRAKEQTSVGIANLLGKYGLYTDKTYVVRDTILAGREENGVAATDAMARVVLAHEMAHALQNQHTDAIAQFGTLVDQDHFHGWSAVSEGGANHLARKVAIDLGLEDTFKTLSRNQGWSEDEGLLHPAAYPIWVRYGRGMAMMDEVVDAGGMDAFWKWHEAPPVDSASIFRPETYRSDFTPPERDLAQVFHGADQQLTRGDWVISNARLGEYALRGDAIAGDRLDDLDEVLTHVVQAQHVELSMTGRTAEIRVVIFDRPESASGYISVLRSEQTANAKNLAAATQRRVEVVYESVNDVAGDDSLFRLQQVGGVERRDAWVARGATLVSIRAERFRPGLRLQRTFDHVFAQLDKL